MRLNHCVRLNTYCSAGVKKCLLVFGCEFVHLIPTRRKNAISMLFTLARPLAVSVPGTSIGVDLTLGHLSSF
jgi:hypothetical protein